MPRRQIWYNVHCPAGDRSGRGRAAAATAFATEATISALPLSDPRIAALVLAREPVVSDTRAELARPTSALPGTPEKIELMRLRLKAGLPPNVAGDLTVQSRATDALTLEGHDHGNGRPMDPRVLAESEPAARARTLAKRQTPTPTRKERG